MTLAPARPGREPAGRRPSSPTSAARCEEVAGRPAATDPAALHALLRGAPRGVLADASSTGRELPWSGSADVVLTGDDVETARFFPDVRLNYAEALLRPLPGVDDDRAGADLGARRPARRALDPRPSCAAEVQRDRGRADRGWACAAGERMVLIAPNTAARGRRRARRRGHRGGRVDGRVRTWAPRRCSAASSRSSRCCWCSTATAMAARHRRGAGRRAAHAAPAGRCSTTCPARRPSTRRPARRPPAADAARGSGWERRPFDTPAVRHVLLRHHRAAEGDGARRRRHAARARQGAPPARRPRGPGTRSTSTPPPPG